MGKLDYFGIEEDIKGREDLKEKEKNKHHSDLSFIDAQYFQNVDDIKSVKEKPVRNVESMQQKPPVLQKQDNSDLNYIDENYFGGRYESTQSHQAVPELSVKTSGSSLNIKAEDLLEIDRQYFGSYFGMDALEKSGTERTGRRGFNEKIGSDSSTERTGSRGFNEKIGSDSSTERTGRRAFKERIGSDSSTERTGSRGFKESIGSDSSTERTGSRGFKERIGSDSSTERNDSRGFNERIGSDSSTERTGSRRFNKRIATKKSATSSQSVLKENPMKDKTSESPKSDGDRMSAAEFVQKYRFENKVNLHMLPNYGRQVKVDSEGFRVPDEVKHKFNYMTADEVEEVLYRCIIGNIGAVVAFNKPYGIPSHPGPQHKYSVTQFLPVIAKRLKLESDLVLVHRLDKETTGVMLCAKGSSNAQLLKEAFHKRWFQKSYLCITKGVPSPADGIIDIPIKEALVAGKYKKVLRPKYNQFYPEHASLMNHYGYEGADEAVTRYSVLDQVGQTALVECRPETGVKHQIRAHLSLALNTPILGDHKYSHISRLAPQRLPLDILRRLRIQQSKVRYLSLHLHAHQLSLIPGEGGQEPPPDLPRLHFRAPIPKFFADNLRRLSLTAPKLLNLARSRII